MKHLIFGLIESGNGVTWKWGNKGDKGNMGNKVDLFYFLPRVPIKKYSRTVKRSLNTVLILSGILLLNSCVEKYWPDLGDKYEKLLVVDGIITNQPGPYTIRLSYSSELRLIKQNAVQGCAVIISDNNGYSEILNELEPGKYVTTNPAFQGVVGRQYKLTIHTPSEQTYESDFQELKNTVGIDSVYAKLEYKPNPDDDHELAGYQFYVSSEASTQDTNYYFWRMEQTYEFNPNYRIRYIFDGQYHAIPHPAPYYTCWKTEPVNKIITYNTLQLNEPVIRDLPLHFVTTETKELSVKYTVLVSQLTLTREAYSYWSSLQDQDAGQGTLYDKQPYQIRGNISNVSDPNEPVLGYFFAAGSDEKRIFVDRPEDAPFYYSTNCGMVTEDLWRMLYSIRHEWPVFLTIIYDGEGGGGTTALPNDQACVDCRESGGDTEKPDFWED